MKVGRSIFMGAVNARFGQLLYHLTQIDNIDSILDNGLMSRRSMKNCGLGFLDVADAGILEGRKEFDLDTYVPFHFHPYSAFDRAVKSRYSESEFIYICIKRDYAKENSFMILLNHPLSKEGVKLYDYEDGLNKIDWKTMAIKGSMDIYTKNVKMAECITTSTIQVKDFHCIYVKDEKTRSIIIEKLNDRGIARPPYVDIQIFCT